MNINIHEPTPESITILLVDDEEMITEVMGTLLKRLNYQVLCVNSGEEAVDIIKAGTPAIDIVVLDLLMPGMDGETTFDAIRTLQPRLPVILSSGQHDRGRVSNILNKGCNDFIQKPYRISELHPKILQILATCIG